MWHIEQENGNSSLISTSHFTHVSYELMDGHENETKQKEN